MVGHNNATPAGRDGFLLYQIGAYMNKGLQILIIQIGYDILD